jgi:hypothetical protein
MTYIKLKGGLGNQLFQIAAAYAYSKKHNTTLHLDDSTWCGGQGKSGTEYKHTIFRNFQFNDVYPRSVIIYKEPWFNYSQIERLKLDNYCVQLDGYFQSLKYFDEYQEEFKSNLCLPTVDTTFIKDENVAFHIRRGDYLNYPDEHYVCKTDYFNRCFDMFVGYQINVFTDSPDYVLNEFKDKEFNLIQTSSELNDLTLMSQHDNVVCSNSTFSWWGSFLGRKKKRIIVPSKWFVGGPEYNDVYREDMTKLDV